MKGFLGIVSAILGASILVGCGSSSDDGAPPPTDKVNQQFEAGPTSGTDAAGGTSKVEQAASDQ